MLLKLILSYRLRAIRIYATSIFVTSRYSPPASPLDSPEAFDFFIHNYLRLQENLPRLNVIISDIQLALIASLTQPLPPETHASFSIEQFQWRRVLRRGD